MTKVGVSFKTKALLLVLPFFLAFDGNHDSVVIPAARFQPTNFFYAYTNNYYILKQNQGVWAYVNGSDSFEFFDVEIVSSGKPAAYELRIYTFTEDSLSESDAFKNRGRPSLIYTVVTTETTLDSSTVDTMALQQGAVTEFPKSAGFLLTRVRHVHDSGKISGFGGIIIKPRREGT